MKQVQKRLLTKSKILKATLDLMTNGTIEELTIRQIARAAGVTTGAVYHYYPSKKDIILDSFNSLNELYKEAHEFSSENFLDTMLSILQLQIKVFEDLNWQRTALYLKSILLNVNIQTVPLVYRELLEQTILAQLNVTAAQAKTIADSCLELVFGITAYWCLSQGQFNLEAEIKEKVSLYLVQL